ncbi:MAG: hypothetical protein Q4C96_03480 [Planctomycetia bacterium]|nr:hypothetical protein [Planctomycetia bacterium]
MVSYSDDYDFNHSDTFSPDYSAQDMNPPFDADPDSTTDEDGMESDPLVHDSSAEYDIYVVEEASREYIGQWNRLISKTNWEKGQLISRWRENMIFSGAPAQLYSDDAWSRRVGNVSPQHVGRLRRVYERFSESYDNFPGLYWSHFQAALDWQDAEVWLEGAVHQRWSVAQMRNQRWVAIGAPPECKPREEDVILSELDEDVTAALDSTRLSGENGTADLNTILSENKKVIADGSLSGTAREEISPHDKENKTKNPSNSFSEPSDHRDSTDETLLSPQATTASPAEIEANMRQNLTPTFGDLPSSLPEDVEEVFEAFKIAILNHKLAKWTRISRTEMLKVLDSLKLLCE